MRIVRNLPQRDVPQSSQSPSTRPTTAVATTTNNSLDSQSTASIFSTSATQTALTDLSFSISDSTTFSARPITSRIGSERATVSPVASAKSAFGSSSPTPHLSNGLIAAITASIAVFLIVVVAIVCLSCRLRRKKSSRPIIPNIIYNKLKRRKSGSSDSLTSFDTRTEVGQISPGRKEQDQLLPRHDTESLGNPKEKRSIRELLSANNSSVNLSSTSLPHFAPSTVQAVLNTKASFETVRSATYPPSYTVGVQSHARSQSSSALPRIKTSFHAPLPHVRSTSDIGTPHRRHPLSPIMDAPSIPPTPLMPSTLSPCQHSPRTLASLQSNSGLLLSAPTVRDCTRTRVSNTKAFTTSPISNKDRIALGVSPTSHRSTLSVASYLSSKPLPPSPPAPPAPPPPFSPPLPPSELQQKTANYGIGIVREPRTQSVISSKFAKTSVQDRGIKSSNEVLLPSQTHKKNLSNTSLRRYKRTHSNIHISSLAKSPVATEDPESLQSPKPVLKLDTSGVGTTPFLQPRVYMATPSLCSATTAATPTPASAAQPTAFTLPSHHVHVVVPSPYSVIQSPGDLLTCTPKGERPISTTATAASSMSPALSDDNGSIMEFNDYYNEPVTPTQYQPPEPPVTVSAVINEYVIPSSASFLQTDPCDVPNYVAKPEENKKLTRSPSISVPIVFRFSYPRKSSLKARLR